MGYIDQNGIRVFNGKRRLKQNEDFWLHSWDCESNLRKIKEGKISAEITLPAGTEVIVREYIYTGTYLSHCDDVKDWTHKKFVARYQCRKSRLEYTACKTIYRNKED